MTDLCFNLPDLKELLKDAKNSANANFLKEYYQDALDAVERKSVVRITNINGANNCRILQVEKDVEAFFLELYSGLI